MPLRPKAHGIGFGTSAEAGPEAKGEGIPQTGGLELGVKGARTIDAFIGSRTLSRALAR